MITAVGGGCDVVGFPVVEEHARAHVAWGLAHKSLLGSLSAEESDEETTDFRMNG